MWRHSKGVSDETWARSGNRRHRRYEACARRRPCGISPASAETRALSASEATGVHRALGAAALAGHTCRQAVAAVVPARGPPASW